MSAAPTPARHRSGFPRTAPHLSRRDALRALAGVGALPLFGVVAAGCATPPAARPDVDALTAELDRARADTALAGAAAAAAVAPAADQLRTIAAQRSAHAAAIGDELTRLTGSAPPSGTPPSGTPPPSTPPAGTSAPGASASGTPVSGTAPGAAPATPPVPTVSDVVAALTRSGDVAAGAARRLRGYPAGLLGSIAASCIAAHTVALAGPGTP